MKCLETRQRHGIKYRRYELDDGRRISTATTMLAITRAAAEIGRALNTTGEQK